MVKLTSGCKCHSFHPYEFDLIQEYAFLISINKLLIFEEYKRTISRNVGTLESALGYDCLV